MKVTSNYDDCGMGGTEHKPTQTITENPISLWNRTKIFACVTTSFGVLSANSP